MAKTAISLFSGCGGSDAGAIACGFDIILANDILPYAKDVYLENQIGTEYVIEDICKITSFPNAQLLIGCYPCQGFSQGGARQPDRKINKLYLEFARALNLVKPQAFVVENVSGMIRSNYLHLLEDQKRCFSEIGYKVTIEVLNAADFGVAQDRKRIFIVGIKSDLGVEYKFPTPTHGKDREFKYSTLRDVIGDMEEWPEGEFCNQDFHWYYLSRNRRRAWNEPSKTILANARHMPLHPISPELIRLGEDEWKFATDAPARRLSYREAARIQGFSGDFILGDDLVFPDTKHSSLMMRYKVIGNAVPPQLFKAVIAAYPIFGIKLFRDRIIENFVNKF